MRELPGGHRAGGAVETLGDGNVGGCGWNSGQGFAVEGVGCRGEVEVVLVATSLQVGLEDLPEANEVASGRGRRCPSVSAGGR